ncbi:MAG TPA: PilZ domain-containing protein [Vicinamibacteria bacterium]|nr:PilZ domain-containing protein [Vicinamibacteria bacterium]
MGQGGPENQDGRDDRRGRRLPVDLPASLGGRLARPARVVDLSLVGCLARLEAPLDEGVVVDLGVELPDGTVRMKARVAESSVDGDSLPGPSRRFLAGLEFLALAAADELRLRAFLEAEVKRRRGAHPAPS